MDGTAGTSDRHLADEPLPQDRLLSAGAAVAVGVASTSAARAELSLPGVAALVLATAGAGSFALSFLCMPRRLTLVGSICTAVSGVALTAAVEPGVGEWRYVWGLGLIVLTIGVVGGVLAYLSPAGRRSPAPAYF